ncbi:hypothetical protein DCC85_02505 [Paenibacillus sp. CAA11]|nr:hypothetical protein DCC85_02505 [Paenibacillus sp. CAA11]
MVSPSDWLVWIEAHPVRAGLAALAVILFLWLYITARRIFLQAELQRMSLLDDSLERLALVSAQLRAAHEPHEPQEQPDRAEAVLTERLEALRIAAALGTDLRGQITVYLDDPDPARLARLARTLSRESERLLDERDKLVARRERPGWGHTLWLQLRPALPAAMLAAALALCAWLAQALDTLPRPYGSAEVWTLACLASRFLSGVFSLLLLGSALLVSRRSAAGSLLARMLALVIALLFLLHGIGLEAAPYVLTVQLLLYALGFRWTDGKPRKARPFPGHYDLLEDEPATSTNESRRESGADS